jgi:4-amino-4-deoxy-L-arabinose transferase-like glycosyltransferase
VRLWPHFLRSGGKKVSDKILETGSRLAEAGRITETGRTSPSSRRLEWTVVLFAALIFLTGIISPPSLMDDVDATQALIARNMLHSGDWVSARLDGVLFLEKPPLKHWTTAILYSILGEHDWVARIPSALSAIALCWVVFRIGCWAFSPKAGYYAGLFLSTCIGLFLFTRIVISDVILTLCVTVAIWAILRALDDDEPNPRLWSYVLAISLAAGILLKSLIGLVFPLGAGFLYLLFTRRLLDAKAWRRLHPGSSLLLFLALAAPWHVLATIRNPPYFAFTLHSGPGEYHGFFWFYFINEQLLRFLNARYPRDYNTVPRLYFWLLHLVWLFPWSVYLPRLFRLSYKPVDRAGRVRLMLLCWIGFVMTFFTFSTTQEYYSMPIYPALALLLGCGIAASENSIRGGARTVAVIAALAALAIGTILYMVHGVPTPGDISAALSTKQTETYTLSMGHMGDLTIASFAYLRLPLVVAGIAFLIGAVGAFRLRGDRAILAMAVMMVLFFQAARLALVVFDPFMSSRPIAEVLKRSPQGTLITQGVHNGLSSVFFYGEDKALMWNGRYFNLEYGSYAPDAPQNFIDDADLARIWAEPQRYYLVLRDETVPHLLQVIPHERLHLVASIGAKSLYSNQSVP